MSPPVPYLTTRPQSSNLWFRRGVPERLRPHLGRREIFLSLETSDKREAGRRCILTAAVVQKMFDTADEKVQRLARRNTSCTSDSVVQHDALEPLTRLRDYFVDDELFVEPLQSWMIPTLLTRYEEASLAGYEDQLECMLPARPSSLAQPGEREKYRKIRTRIFELECQNYAEQLAQLRDAILDEDTDIIESSASAHLYGEKLSELTTDEKVLQQYKLQLMKTELEVLKKIQARLHGEGTPIPERQTPHASEHDNWGAFLQTWQRIRKPRPKSISEASKIAEEWKHFTNDMPTAAMTKKMYAGGQITCVMSTSLHRAL